MDMRLSEEERMLQNLFAQFFAREFPPPIARQSEHDMGGGGGGFQLHLWRELTALGMLHLTLPLDAGGLELGEGSTLIVAEQIGRAAYNCPYVDTVAAAELLWKVGAGTPLEAVIEELISGAGIVALALRHFSDFRMTRTAVGWQLDGECRLVPFAVQADHLLFVQGGHLALVPRHATGITIRRQDEIGRGEVYLVRLKEVEVSEGSIRTLPEGLLEQVLTGARVRHAAYLIGLGQGALELTMKYTRERRQFGQPIGTFQSLAFRMAAMATRIEAARLLAYRIAWDLDQGSAAVGGALQLLAMAGDLAREVTTEAIQLHGSFGISEEAEPQRYYRRAIADSLLWGRASEHRTESVRVLVESVKEAGAVAVMPSLRPRLLLQSLIYSK